MSFALPTLTLLYLLTPGLIFRRFYFTGEFSIQYFKPTFSDLLISTILPSVLIHLICYCCVMPWYVLDTTTFGVLISGTDKSQEISSALKNLHDLKVQIIFYLALTCALAASLGLVIKFLVRRFKFDRTHRMFRFSNQWHYLFTGEILDFPGFPGRTEEIELRFVDVLVDIADGSVLYSGYLSEYILNKAGGIDSIYMRDVRRRYLRDDRRGADAEPYYALPGQFFIIPFSEIKNLHITYYSIIADEETEMQVNDMDPSIIE